MAKTPSSRTSLTVPKSNASGQKSATRSAARPKRSTRRIEVRGKGLTQAAEPPIDANPQSLLPAFSQKLEAALAQLAAANTPFRLVEGYRTTDRQQWLFGSGRPLARPYGRAGPILTNADGVRTRSKHQGDGNPGSGVAADCYPTRNGRLYIPPSTDPIWNAYADAVEAQGLVAGHRWTSIRDSPHCELA